MSRRRIDVVAKKQDVVRAPLSDDPIEALIVRARKSNQKGDTRRALVTLRQACNLEPERPRSWTLLGAFLSNLGQREEAFRAFQQARWLRLRAGDKARVAVMDRLALQVAPEAA